MIFVTGGSGFIGSNFILNWFKNSNEMLLNIDKLTYAGNMHNLESLSSEKNYIFYKSDIGNTAKINDLLNKYRPRAVINFAAESHVDNSIRTPRDFFETNVMSTFDLLNVTKEYWEDLELNLRNEFRFIHISTDEVYGSLAKEEKKFTEDNKFYPNSPYSASKAASDHIMRSYFHTFDFPVITTNCSNNYGPYQFPEKLIPVVIQNAINGKDIPLYGDGLNIRDWLHVDDHCKAILEVFNKGSLGEVYNIGGLNEITNKDLVEDICCLLDELKPKESSGSYKDQVIYVKDRLGHDRRYAIDSSKIQSELGWKPSIIFKNGLRSTVIWYLENEEWLKNISSGAYRKKYNDQT